MVGGRVIEINHVHRGGRVLVRLWVIDPKSVDELCVYAEPAEVMPKVGDEVWWQAGKIYFDRDRRHLRKVAYSFRPGEAA